MMDYATPMNAQDNQTNLVCPSSPEPRKKQLITFDGINVVLPFQVQLTSKSYPTSGPADEFDREVIFSLKPRSSYLRTVSEGLTTKIPIVSIPPPPFGYTQHQENDRSLSNPDKLPSQLRPRPVARAKQRHTLSARCA